VFFFPLGFVAFGRGVNHFTIFSLEKDIVYSVFQVFECGQTLVLVAF